MSNTPMSASLSLSMPGLDVDKLAREAIAVELTKAFAKSPDIINAIVARALALKVNDHGNLSQYSRENQTPWIEYLLGSMIRGVVQQAVKDHVDALKPEIEKQITAELRRSSKAIARQAAEAFVATGKSQFYKMNIDIGLKASE